MMLTKEDNLLDIAIRLATAAHINEVDKSGVKYIFHPLRVMLALSEEDEATQIIAVMHDVLESNSNINYLELIFGKEIFSSLVLLTKTKDQTYSEYIDRIVESKDMRAIKVKIKDIEDNLREVKGSEQLINSYNSFLKPRYTKALLKLKEGIKISDLFIGKTKAGNPVVRYTGVCSINQIHKFFGIEFLELYKEDKHLACAKCEGLKSDHCFITTESSVYSTNLKVCPGDYIVQYNSHDTGKLKFSNIKEENIDDILRGE